jgi:hypothetical protein
MNRYRVVDKGTEEVVAVGFHSRQEARIEKARREDARQAWTVATKRRNAFYVETSDEHPEGPGIYLH